MQPLPAIVLPSEQLAKLARRLDLDVHRLAALGMLELELDCSEVEPAARAAALPPVLGVAHDGEAEHVGAVDAQLVGAPGVRREREAGHVPTAQPERARPAQHAPARSRALPVDRLRDHAGLAVHVTTDDRLVALPDAALGEGAREADQRRLRLRAQEHARRRLIQPVHAVRSVERARRAEGRRAQRMHDRRTHRAAGRAARRRVCAHARRLEHDGQSIVLVHHAHVERRAAARRKARRHTRLQRDPVAG